MSIHKNKNWTPESWKKFPIKQQPTYNDEEALNKTLDKIKKFPTLVMTNEIRDLKRQLASVANGEAFLLQGGDCAESFAEFNQVNLDNYFKAILQMTVALMYGAGKPVVKVGRIAGQFAKPRSADNETVEGVELPSYRGDIINNIDFTEGGRQNDPENLERAYYQSAATLNYLRGLSKSGKSGLKNIDSYNNEFVKNSNQGKRFESIVEDIKNSNDFMRACGISTDTLPQLQEADFFVSHEGLLLNYEECFVRKSDTDNKFYDCSAHLLWIGDRTRKLDEAHIEFFRGIDNPIASKVGPSMQEDELIELIDTLNPENEPGRLTLISRFGKDKVNEYLPKFVKRVKQEGRNVIWSCDPMHGNTIKAANGYKTRPFNDILSEVRSFFQIHEA